MPLKRREGTPPPAALGALAALQRAARRARVIAAQTGTYLVIVRDGKIVWEVPGPEFFPKPPPPKEPTSR